MALACASAATVPNDAATAKVATVDAEELQRLKALDSLMQSLAEAHGITAQELSSMPLWTAGASNSLQLYYYEPSHGNRVKPWCVKPDSALSELVRRVQVSQPASSPADNDCTASLTTGTLAGPLATVSCRLGATQTCDNRYVAMIWTERDRSSVTNYAMRAVTIIRRYCANKKDYYEPDENAKELANATGKSLNTFVTDCVP